MTDLNGIFQKSLREARKGNTFAPADELQKLQDSGVVADSGYDASTCNNIHFDETNEEALLNAEYGPQQVQSLLSLVVDFPLHKRLEDAKDDVLAVHQLNQLNSHRRGDR